MFSGGIERDHWKEMVKQEKRNFRADNNPADILFVQSQQWKNKKNVMCVKYVQS